MKAEGDLYIFYEADRLRRLGRLPPGAVFEWLNSALPVVGTAIDWTNVDGTHRHWFATSEVDVARVVAEVLASLPAPSEQVLHEGDSLSPFPVTVTVGQLPSVIGALLEIPEHHYFVDAQHRWLAVFRTEGDVDLLIFDTLDISRDCAEDE